MHADQGPTETAAPGFHRPPLVVRSLGVVPYEVALNRQRQLVKARQADETPDHLLLLEHPAVITIGVPPYSWSIINDNPFDIPLSM